MSDPDLGRRPAQLGRRIGAYVIDGAVGMVVLLIAVGIFAGISFGTGGALPLPVAVLLAYVIGLGWFVVYTFMQAGAGSLGMRALGLRLVLVDQPGATRLGFGKALVRNVIWALASAIIVGPFSPLFDSSPWHRGWHDRVSGAVMTDVAGRGAVLPHAAEAPASGPDAEKSPTRPSTLAPTVLPAAPILPVGDAPDLAGWTPSAAPVAARPTPAVSGLISFVPGVSDTSRLDAVEPAARSAVPTVDAPPAPAPAPAVSAAAPVVSDSHAVSSGLIENLDETRVSTGERPDARLVWDDGARQAVYGRTLFGRNPAPETGAMVSPVRDETLSLSKTHFELIPDGDRTLWVVDRHSTNGVGLRRGGELQHLVPGERTRVRQGDVLEFGDRQVTIELAS